MACIVELILTNDLRGSGTKEDPYRRVNQLFTRSGELVAEEDSVVEGGNRVDFNGLLEEVSK